VNWDNALLFAGMVAEAALIGLLLYRRVWRILPIFCIYIVCALLVDMGNYAVQWHFAGLSSPKYFDSYIAAAALEAVLEIGVLVELAWSVLRPLRSSLSYRAPILVGLLFVVAGAAAWHVLGVKGLSVYPAGWRNLVHLEQTMSVLRILFFVLLAGCSQLLSIGWRDRELQVATGLGFFSFVTIAVDMLHQHQDFGPNSNYAYLDRFKAAAYLCSLLYWGFSFAQKEAARREFTPQMQSFLLAVAGNARSTRIAVSGSGSGKSSKRDE
jgi:hypothetical protein